MKIIEGHKLPLYSNYFNTDAGNDPSKANRCAANWIIILKFKEADIYVHVLGNVAYGKETFF